MNFEILFMLFALAGMVAALIWDGMRPGMVLLTVVVLFLCTGILSPREMLEGFSNKGMITVGLLFLVSEGGTAKWCPGRAHQTLAAPGENHHL